jgi:hypothetical protein
MGKKKITLTLSDSSIENVISELQSYKQEILDKCERLVSELANSGIEVAKSNTGNHFGHYITFSMRIEPNNSGCTAVIVATETGQITSQWQTSDGIKSADVSPLLMAEFGSGWKAQPHFDDVRGGQGTFPDQTHAFDREGWYWRDLDGEFHHSYGITPTMPMYKAYNYMEQNIISKAKEVFG